MEQKQVYLTSLRVENYKTIQAVVLTPDILKNRLVRVTGEIGNGKSTLLEALQIALSGAKVAAKKDSLPNSFITEAQITDGNHKLYIGAKVREVSRGAKKGETEFDTFLYEKDVNGKVISPVVEGAGVTAKEYMDMLHTDVTFNMPDLFDKNQTSHRKIIEKTFSAELHKLGIDEVIDRITKAEGVRDNARALCDAHGAFMSTFEAEGYEEYDLQLIKRVDESALLKKLTELEIEKDRILNSTETKKLLAESEARSERNKQLNAIEGKIRELTEKIRALNAALTESYSKTYSKYAGDKELLDRAITESNSLISSIKQACFITDNKEAIGLCQGVSRNLESFKLTKEINELVCPKKPVVIDIVNGVPEVNSPIESYDPKFKPLWESRIELLDKYKKLKDSPLTTQTNESDKPANTENIDTQLESVTKQMEASKKINGLVDRYELWIDWIEKKGLYEKEVDVLRKLYAQVDTGVPGLIIVPEITKTKRVEIWLKYNGQYDDKFFGNTKKEDRYLFDYSQSQSGVIGLLIQAARLDIKPKAMRLALLDDVPMTKMGIDLLNKLCEEKDLHLWTTQTSDQYSTEDPDKGQVIIENGEIFFGR